MNQLKTLRYGCNSLNPELLNKWEVCLKTLQLTETTAKNNKLLDNQDS